jgi:penicillin-binding protein 1A
MGVTGPVGGKTGTTDAYRDAWFVGFSSTVVAGVWVGFDQPAPIRDGAYGARVALPIWADFMKAIAAIRPASEFNRPDGLDAVELCSVSHLKATSACPLYTEYFKPGEAVPSETCQVHPGSPGLRAVQALEGFFRFLGRTLSGRRADPSR